MFKTLTFAFVSGASAIQAVRLAEEGSLWCFYHFAAAVLLIVWARTAYYDVEEIDGEDNEE